jgi:hypothetical protein
MKKSILILVLGCFVSVIAQDEQPVPDLSAEEDFSIETEPPLTEQPAPAVSPSTNPPAQEVVTQETIVEQPVAEPSPQPVPVPEQPAAQPAVVQPEQVSPQPAPESVPVAPQVVMPSVPAPAHPEPAMAPAAPSPYADTEEDVVLPEIEGIDTVDLESPQGNWLFKRIWWERAEQKYEKIRAIVQSIFESRMRFFSTRNEVDKSILDPFYIGIGLSQGELQALLDQLIATLEKEREDQGALDANERSVLNAVRNEREMLEQMHKDVMAINQLDRDIDDALSQLMEQINRVRGYDSEAWQAFKEIARVLDDTKARELYYRVDTAGRNIKDIRTYIDVSYAPHFDQLVVTVREQVDRVQSTVAALKEKGIDFKMQVERLTKAPVAQEEEQEEEESGGIISSIFSAIGSFFSSIWGIIRWPYDLIFGGGGQVEEVEIEEED